MPSCNGQYPRTNSVIQYQKGKRFWALMQQEMTECKNWRPNMCKAPIRLPILEYQYSVSTGQVPFLPPKRERGWVDKHTYTLAIFSRLVGMNPWALSLQASMHSFNSNARTHAHAHTHTYQTAWRPNSTTQWHRYCPRWSERLIPQSNHGGQSVFLSMARTDQFHPSARSSPSDRKVRLSLQEFCKQHTQQQLSKSQWP